MQPWPHLITINGVVSDPWTSLSILIRPVTSLCSIASAQSLVQMRPFSTSSTSAAFTFDITTGGKGTDRQQFEWRRSHVTEIKQLATSHSYCYKLVWLSGPTNGAGGSRKERDLGMSSDGLEIVAVIAHNASMSMTKGFRFNYTTTGNRTLGEDWEVITLVSALQLWLLDVLGVSNAGTAPTIDTASY